MSRSPPCFNDISVEPPNQCRATDCSGVSPRPSGRRGDRSRLAHLIRAAKGLAESVEVGMGRFGRRVHTELQRLCHMGTERPTVGQWGAWYARFHALLNQYATRQDKAGTLARRLAREGEVLWMFLDVQGVEATNNIAGVRFVDQKPALNKAWGIDPERKSSDAQA